MLQRVACLVGLSLLTSACVVPTTGTPLFEAASDRRPFPVELVRPGQVLTGSVGGVLERVEPGGIAVVQGWSPRADARLVVVTSTPVDVLSERRVLRPDAAAVTGGPDPDLGFRLLLRARTGGIDSVCVVAVTPEAGVLLAGSDPVLCPEPA